MGRNITVLKKSDEDKKQPMMKICIKMECSQISSKFNFLNLEIDWNEGGVNFGVCKKMYQIDLI